MLQCALANATQAEWQLFLRSQHRELMRDLPICWWSFFWTFLATLEVIYDWSPRQFYLLWVVGLCWASFSWLFNINDFRLFQLFMFCSCHRVYIQTTRPTTDKWSHERHWIENELRTLFCVCINNGQYSLLFTKWIAEGCTLGSKKGNKLSCSTP